MGSSGGMAKHNDTIDIQGGSAGQRYHLTASQHGRVDLTGCTEGVLADPTITDTDGSAISVTSVDCLIRSDSIWGGALTQETVPAVASLAVTDNTLNYVYVDYGGGAPIYAVTTDSNDLNHSDHLPVARIYISGGNIKYQLLYGYLSRGAAVRNIDRIYRTRGVEGSERELGLAISETATRVVNVGSGYAWSGLRRLALDAVAQGGAGVLSSLWYHSSGIWTESGITQYNNSQYDNGTNLEELTPNRYAVNWVYRNLVDNEIDIVLGSGDYTLAQAEASDQPAIPDAVRGFYLLAGRIIVQKDASSARAIESVVSTTFSHQAVSIHNDLADIQGGTIGEYYHVTAAEKAWIESQMDA
jgi:hypothetical protein